MFSSCFESDCTSSYIFIVINTEGTRRNNARVALRATLVGGQVSAGTYDLQRKTINTATTSATWTACVLPKRSILHCCGSKKKMVFFIGCEYGILLRTRCDVWHLRVTTLQKKLRARLSSRRQCLFSHAILSLG